MTLDQHFATLIERIVDEKLPALVEEKLRAMGDEWLTVREAHEMTKLSEWTIRQMARKGEVKIYQPNPGKPPLRISRNSLQNLIPA